MNIVNVLFVLLVSCYSLNAQDTAAPIINNYFVGGAASFSTSTNDNTPDIVGTIIISNPSVDDIKTTSYSFSPTMGRRISEHLSVGLRLRYAYTSVSTESTSMLQFIPSGPPVVSRNNRIERSYGAGIFARYSFNPQNKLQFYVEPMISYAKSTSDFTGIISDRLTVEDIDNNSASLSAGVGLMYNVSDRFRLITRLGGLSYETGSIDTRTRTRIADTNQDIFTGSTGTMLFTEDNMSSRNFSTFATNFSIANIQFGAEYLF